MANCPPIQRGLINYKYDLMTDRRAVAFDDYVWKDFQAAAITAELIYLTNVLDAKAPPWNGDETATPAVFRRKIANFGTIWYAFVLIGRMRCLLVLTGTCDGVDDSNRDVRKARREVAERRVDELRQEGVLC